MRDFLYFCGSLNHLPMNRKRIVFAVLSLCVLLCACKQKQNHEKDNEEDQNYEYPMTVIQDTIDANVMDKAELYPMTEEFRESFLEKAANYPGHHITAKSALPEEWGVRCVERLPEGRELWLIQSKSREWVYLAVTSGFGTQRLIDLMPAALALTNQNDDVLETEKWQTVREPDGAFLVSKEYEWTRSLTNATKQDYIADPGKFHRTTTYLDKYYINESGRFVYSEVVDSIPEYSAVVFFYNRNDKPEFWDDNIPRLQAFCEENNIFYEEVYNNYDQVNISDFTMAPILTIDINPFITNMESGMVMLKKGEDPKAIHLGGFEYMQMEIKRFYKISNPPAVAL